MVVLYTGTNSSRKTIWYLCRDYNLVVHYFVQFKFQNRNHVSDIENTTWWSFAHVVLVKIVESWYYSTLYATTNVSRKTPHRQRFLQTTPVG